VQGLVVYINRLYLSTTTVGLYAIRYQDIESSPLCNRNCSFMSKNVTLSNLTFILRILNCHLLWDFLHKRSLIVHKRDHSAGYVYLKCAFLIIICYHCYARGNEGDDSNNARVFKVGLICNAAYGKGPIE